MEMRIPILIAELTSARDDLTLLWAEARRRYSDARTAVWLATEGGVKADSRIGTGEGRTPSTVAALGDWVKQSDAEVVDFEERLMQVDVRLAQASGKVLGYVH